MTVHSTIHGGTRVERSTAVAEVELDGEAVLYHQHLRTVSVLNPTATLVWAKLGPSRDLDALGAELAELFGADRDAVTRDVVRTVEEFDRQGLVVALGPGPGS